MGSYKSISHAVTRGTLLALAWSTLLSFVALKDQEHIPVHIRFCLHCQSTKLLNSYHEVSLSVMCQLTAVVLHNSIEKFCGASCSCLWDPCHLSNFIVSCQTSLIILIHVFFHPALCLHVLNDYQAIWKINIPKCMPESPPFLYSHSSRKHSSKYLTSGRSHEWQQYGLIQNL